ncbi:MAG: hypothetical protein M1269_12295 [Chloroflexi bacterium]|nr:hypothetical protein [Chloroflexota bacterium]
MKKILILSLAVVMLFAAVSAAWCDTQDDVTKQLTNFYNDVKTGNVDDMTKMLTVETAKKIKTSATTNVLGNLDQIFGIAQSVKDGKSEVFMSGINFEFPEVEDNKVVVRVSFKSIINSEGTTITNDGKHEIVLLNEQGKWYIMNLTDLMSTLK